MQRIQYGAAAVILAAGLFGGSAASAWDHRSMQSHHEGVESQPRALAPGETRIGRIEIGPPATASDQVPGTLERATQRQWIQRSGFPDGGGSRPGNAPRIRAGRSDGTRGR